MSTGAKIFLGLLVVGFLLALLGGGMLMMFQVFNRTTRETIKPVQEANQTVQTQVAQLLNPTPTIKPDPITIIHEVRSLARLETIQYSVEKVITAELSQGSFDFLFGDRLLFVAHGSVIAGIDLQKLKESDFVLHDNVLYVNLPPAEIFSATLDNSKSYIYDRSTGLLQKGDLNLETQARTAAEEEIRKAALEDGIMEQAQLNAENYLSRLLRQLGFPDVMFGLP